MANGIINGSCRGAAGGSYRIWIEWNAVAVPSENHSILSASAYLQRSDGYKYSAYHLSLAKKNKYIAVDGEYAFSDVLGIDTRNLKKVLIAQITDKIIPHNNDGNKQVVLEAAVKNINAPSLTDGFVSGVATFDHIDSSAAYFSGEPVLASATQTTATISVPYENADSIQYSFDGAEWLPFIGSISGLQPYTNYSVLFKIENSQNNTSAISGYFRFRTLPIYIERIDITPPVVSYLHEKTPINYTIFPEIASVKDLLFYTEDENIMIVEGNSVFGVNIGKTTIYAKATDGSGEECVARAIVSPQVEKITTPYSQIAVEIGKPYTPFFAVYPVDTYDRSYRLVSSDENILSVNGTEITGVAEGFATLTAISNHGEYEVDCSVQVVDGYTWTNYVSPPVFLNTEDIANFYENTKTIWNMLASLGIPLNDLIETKPGKDTPFAEVLDILQNIEYNIDAISDNEYKSVYYKAPVTVTQMGSEYDDIFRWINILNDMFNMLVGNTGRWSVVLLNDGYPTIEGNKILIRRT